MCCHTNEFSLESCRSITFLNYRAIYNYYSDRETDLDVPECYTKLTDYSATMGHKACHSFEHKNSKFEELYHPRYFLIVLY
jgi:hypothetical protein